MPYRCNTDIQSLRAGFFGGGVNVTALAETADCGSKWQAAVVYKTSSAAPILLLSFL